MDSPSSTTRPHHDERELAEFIRDGIEAAAGAGVRRLLPWRTTRRARSAQPTKRCIACRATPTASARRATSTGSSIASTP